MTTKASPAWLHRLDDGNTRGSRGRAARALVLAALVFAAAIVVVAVYNSGAPPADAEPPQREPNAADAAQLGADKATLQLDAVDLKSHDRRIKGADLPYEESLTKKVLSTEVKEVFVRTVRPVNGCSKPIPVLLLHGASFSSATWDELDTVKILASNGYCVTATDLPGFGRSEGKVPSPYRGAYLEAFIKESELENVVIVAPSMSGAYALPVVMRSKVKLGGFVAIAPSTAKDYSAAAYEKVLLPTLIMYGEKDAGGASLSKLLSNIPNSEMHVFKNGSHPCYLNDPHLFHKLLLEFLEKLSKQK